MIAESQVSGKWVLLQLCNSLKVYQERQCLCLYQSTELPSQSMAIIVALMFSQFVIHPKEIASISQHTKPKTVSQLNGLRSGKPLVQVAMCIAGKGELDLAKEH